MRESERERGGNRDREGRVRQEIGQGLGAFSDL